VPRSPRMSGWCWSSVPGPSLNKTTTLEGNCRETTMLLPRQIDERRPFILAHFGDQLSRSSQTSPDMEPRP
jgi:hypothetical protein